MLDYINEARKIYDLMVLVRRDLHMHPELDRDLKYTSSLIERYLKEYKIEYTKYKNNGIIANIGSGEKIIALRGDMDALNILDLKDVPYKSKIEGVMHACGHDAHTAILLGAGVILKNLEEKLKCSVRLIFQPAEETDGGAKDMIEYGCLEGVSAIAGLHVDETLDVGTIGVKRGVVCAASNPFKILISGKGAHGASPEKGVDAILAAAKIIENIQTIISREISALDSGVITIGKINGGTAANAVASQVVLEGIIRTLGKDLREFVLNRVKEITENTAKLYRCSAQVDFIESYPSFNNDDELYFKFLNLLGNIKEVTTIEIQRPVMSVEDFAYYSERVQGLYYKLGSRNIEKGIDNPAHGSYFDIDEECMIYGCAAQIAFALEYR